MTSTTSRSVTVPTTASAPKLLELCEQYFIAGWLSSPQYEHYREQLQIMIQQHTTSSISHSRRSNGIELLAQQIQDAISTSQKKEEQQQLAFDENVTLAMNKKATTTKNSIAVTTNIPLICTPLEFQAQVASQNTNIKELFAEMCFYARLGYIQPPCCLHCTYTECYTPTEEGNAVEDGGKPQLHTNKTKSKTVQYDNEHKCHRHVVWRKDTNIILHPDTIATNIVILPCYLVRQLLQDGSDQQQPPQNGGKVMMIESTKYQYDPIHKSITLK